MRLLHKKTRAEGDQSSIYHNKNHKRNHKGGRLVDPQLVLLI